MDPAERSAAVFGSFDGTVSVIGFVFGLLIHHSPEQAIAIGGLGGAISATVSMATGQYESTEGNWRPSLRAALVMGAATLLGSLIPIWPFFVFDKTIALVVAAIGCLVVAAWIGYEKGKGVTGYAISFATLIGAAGLTLGVIAAIPGSAG